MSRPLNPALEEWGYCVNYLDLDHERAETEPFDTLGEARTRARELRTEPERYETPKVYRVKYYATRMVHCTFISCP